MALDYAGRCERYARQRGWPYDPHRMSIDRLTPAQRRRALRKERHQWPLPEREEKMAALPAPDKWNAAIEHSTAHPTHILGPYHDGNGDVQMDCVGDGDPYEPNCDFDTARLPAASR